MQKMKTVNLRKHFEFNKFFNSSIICLIIFLTAFLFVPFNLHNKNLPSYCNAQHSGQIKQCINNINFNEKSKFKDQYIEPPNNKVNTDFNNFIIYFPTLTELTFLDKDNNPISGGIAAAEGGSFQFKILLAAAYSNSTYTCFAQKQDDSIIKEILTEDSEIFTVENIIYDVEIVVEDLVLNKYELSYYIDGVLIDTVQNITYGTKLNSIQAPEIPPLYGYDITAPFWAVYDGETAVSDFEIISDCNVYAVYTINIYTVTFIMPDNSKITFKVEHGQSVTERPLPKGYIKGDILTYSISSDNVQSDLFIEVKHISIIALIVLTALLILLTVVLIIMIRRLVKLTILHQRLAAQNRQERISLFDITTYKGRTLNEILNNKKFKKLKKGILKNNIQCRIFGKKDLKILPISKLYFYTSAQTDILKIIKEI